jgi:hypothetical protein
MGGIIAILIEAGINGIYLDHSEIMAAFSEDSVRCFQQFLAARYSAKELKDRFGLDDIAAARTTSNRADPMWPESALFVAASEAEFHRCLRDRARQRDPDFIIAGNLWGGHSFQTAALNGSDIQLAGAVDTFLYSELATGTQSAERGQRNLPGVRDGVRTSMAPLIRVLTASSRTGAATSYTYYPQTPNPIPTKDALLNIQRLAMAEAFANHTAFRRVEGHHVEPVREAAKSVYDLLRRVEADVLGAEMAGNVAVVASLEPCYYGRYSYHLEVSRALADAGIAHEMIAPWRLSADALAKYRAVVLPNTAVVSAAAFQGLLDHAGAGGAVIAFGEVGVLDRRGGTGPAASLVAAPPFTCISADAERLRHDGEFVRHAAWARGEWPDSLRGTMDAVVSATMEAAGAALTAQRHDPPAVEVTAMRRPGSDQLILHAVNYGVDLDGTVTPAENVRISVAPDVGSGPEGVRWYALDGVTETLPVTMEGGRAQFAVPTLEIYGIAVIGQAVSAGPRMR